MAKLNDLGLGNEQIGTADFDSMPEQMMGGFPDPPQPGPFRFRLPVSLGNVWDKAEKKKADGTTEPRIMAKFDRDNPLLIVQSLGNRYNGEPFETRISNVERKRGKDEGAVEVSDFDYLLRDSFGEQKRPKTNKEYAEALIKHAGQEFDADIEWNYSCNPGKNIRVANAEGTLEEVEGQVGCGLRYYTNGKNAVQKVQPEGGGAPEFPLHITCGGCNADLRAFANLTRFRGAKK